MAPTRLLQYGAAMISKSTRYIKFMGKWEAVKDQG